MAVTNTLGAYNPIFYATETLIHLRNALGMAQRVHRGYELERNSFGLGDTINIRKPSTFTSQAAPGTSANLDTETAVITLDQWKEVRFELTDKERAFTGERIVEEHIDPAAYALADDIDTTLAALFKDTGFTFDYGAAADATILIDTRRVLFDNRAPMDNNLHFMIDGALEATFLNLEVFHAADVAGAAFQGPLLRGTLGTRFGVEVFANQNTPSHTAGTAAGGGDVDGTISAQVNKGDTTVPLATLTGSETLLKGDAFKIAGNDQVYAVTADLTLSTGAGTASINPPAVQTYINGSAVTITTFGDTNPHVQQLMFHRNAFALVMAPLPDDLPGAESFTATDPVSGLSVRASRYWDGANSKLVMVIDALWGVKTLDPNLAVRAFT